MKSEFYWGFLSSLIVAILMYAYQYSQIKKDLHTGEYDVAGITFGFLPFLIIYFVVGVIMLFNKKSEKFAKGLLLSALIIFLIIIFLSQQWIKI